MFDKQFEQMLNIDRSEEEKLQSKQLLNKKIKATEKNATSQYYTVLSIATVLAIILFIGSLSSTALPPQSAEIEKHGHIINSIALREVDADKTYNLQSIFLLETRQNDSEAWLTKLEQLLQHLEPIENPHIDWAKTSADHLLIQYDTEQNIYYKILYAESGTFVFNETNEQYYSSAPLHFNIRDHFKGLGFLGILILVALLAFIYIGSRFFNKKNIEEPAWRIPGFPLLLTAIGIAVPNTIYGTFHLGLLGINALVFFLLISFYNYKRYRIKTSLKEFIFMIIFTALFMIFIFKI